MRNLLALIGLLVVGAGGVGWYMGWYQLSVNRTTDGNLEIKTNVDTKKVTTDGSTWFKNLSAAVEQKANQTVKDGNTPAGTPGATPGPAAPSSGSLLNPLSGPTAPEAATRPTRSPLRLFPPK